MQYSDRLIETLRSGGVAVLRTDTLYGVVGRADMQETVERIYAAKGRTPTKSPIVLISSVEQLFDRYDETTLEAVHAYWPGRHSIILPSAHAPEWITRGNNSVAYRVPGLSMLRELLEVVGPLVAPSANIEGQPPARTIEDAREYFGDFIDHYEDGGACLHVQPSNLWQYKDGTFIKLR